MSAISSLRRQQLLREAEGYLELLELAHRFPLDPAERDAVAQRSLDALAALEQSRGRRGQVLFLKGQALRTMERHAEAIEAFRAAAEFDSQNVQLWLAMGWCYKRIGRLDLAIQALEECLGLDGEQAIIHYNLACYWALARNAKLSVEYLTNAFELDAAYRDLVGSERDFDPIRRDPAFQALTSVIV